MAADTSLHQPGQEGALPVLLLYIPQHVCALVGGQYVKQCVEQRLVWSPGVSAHSQSHTQGPCSVRHSALSRCSASVLACQLYCCRAVRVSRTGRCVALHIAARYPYAQVLYVRTAAPALHGVERGAMRTRSCRRQFGGLCRCGLGCACMVPEPDFASAHTVIYCNHCQMHVRAASSRI